MSNIENHKAIDFEGLGPRSLINKLTKAKVSDLSFHGNVKGFFEAEADKMRKGTLLVAECVFLTDAAAEAGRTKVYEFLMYKTGAHAWYGTFYAGPASLLGAFRRLHNIGIQEDLFIKDVRMIEVLNQDGEVSGTQMYAAVLPPNPKKQEEEDSKFVEWN